MSSRITTATPFIDRELLLKALDAVGCRYTIQGNEILLTDRDRQDRYGPQKFVLQFSIMEGMQKKYSFVCEDTWGSSYATSFIAAVGRAYNSIYAKQLEELERKRLAAIAEAERLRKEQMAEQERLRLLAIAEEERKRAEEEKQRLERERKEYVEKQRAAIIEKAKEQGYDIQETMVDNKIKLVLVQTTY